jgi:hypothetical protein
MAACTEKYYIESATDLLTRIARIEAIILALEARLLAGADVEDVNAYSLDDGQVKINTQYRSTAAMMKGLHQLDTLRQRLINQLNGRSTVLRSWQGLRC